MSEATRDGSDVELLDELLRDDQNPEGSKTLAQEGAVDHHETMYDLMKTVQESMSTMAKSMMILSQQQETRPRGRDTAVKKQHCERKKRRSLPKNVEDNARERRKSRTKVSTDTESGEVSANESDMSCTDHSNGDDAEDLLIGAKTSKQDDTGSVKDHSDPSLVKVFDDKYNNCQTKSTKF